MTSILLLYLFYEILCGNVHYTVPGTIGVLCMCEENREKENENYVLSNAMLCFAFVMY